MLTMEMAIGLALGNNRVHLRMACASQPPKGLDLSLACQPPKVRKLPTGAVQTLVWATALGGR
jgi:hypothetical protein